MYKVSYIKVAVMPDGTKGNTSQGTGIAYMNCCFSDVKEILDNHLGEKKNPTNAIINKCEKIAGHIITIA